MRLEGVLSRVVMRTLRRVLHLGGAHFYLSTACLHERSESCRQRCKFCPALCRHDCHRPGS